MTEKKKARGPDPEILRIPLPFEEAVRAALETPASTEKHDPKKTSARKAKAKKSA